MEVISRGLIGEIGGVLIRVEGGTVFGEVGEGSIS